MGRGGEEKDEAFLKQFPGDLALDDDVKTGLEEAEAKAKKKTKSLSDNNATWRLSDHRVVWMQLRVFP